MRADNLPQTVKSILPPPNLRELRLPKRLPVPCVGIYLPPNPSRFFFYFVRFFLIIYPAQAEFVKETSHPDCSTE